MVSGANFLNIQADAVGILSSDNDNPLMFNNNHTSSVTYRIVNQSDNSLTLEQNLHFAHNTPTYLGALVSQDGAVVYWVNDTRPLP